MCMLVNYLLVYLFFSNDHNVCVVLGPLKSLGERGAQREWVQKYTFSIPNIAVICVKVSGNYDINPNSVSAHA